MTDTDEIKGTATFRQPLDADRDDIQVFRREHGDDKLAKLEVTNDFFEREMTRRMAETELRVSNYAGITPITKRDRRGRPRNATEDPWLDRQLRDDVFE